MKRYTFNMKFLHFFMKSIPVNLSFKFIRLFIIGKKDIDTYVKKKEKENSRHNYIFTCEVTTEFKSEWVF